MKKKRYGFLLFNIATLVSMVWAITRVPEIANLNTDIVADMQPVSKPEIDLVTIKTLIRQVSTQSGEPQRYLNRIDSMAATIQAQQVRNPFEVAPVQVLLVPTKIEKKATVEKKPKRKPLPKIVRPKVVINGIVWDVQEPYAILNGELYRVGDEFKGYTVYAILDTTVVFKNDRDKYVVNYHQE